MKTTYFYKYSYILFALLTVLFVSSCGDDEVVASCNDGIKNGTEVGIDCGGTCPSCFTCVDGILNGNETGIDCGGDCIACPTCIDGIQNGIETGVDCGGDCPACPDCNDGIQNGDETGVDCGGSCAACPTCVDGMQNGDETGVDCGGTICPPCTTPGCTDPNAHNYNVAADVDDGSCETCSDGLQNGDETDVDCGGILCDPCYSVGGAGPAGGLIFYDKGSFSDGWRYLEYGIEIQNGDKIWGCNIANNTSFLVGTGFENSENVLANFQSGACAESPDAFLACSELDRNGFDDWYLPSVNELQELYPYRGQLGLADKRYWSSSELDAVDAYVVDFNGENSDGTPLSYTWFKIVTGGNQGLSSVVAIRRF